ncbi:DNA polymerase eta isoform X2 [Tripterygium wilfordii]|uniref:DNA polymerase eta isoform X2 n=1 Tax=Tripterygium wilfordii TaxID=458696 RepID=UPI0018F82778|nr:DNA polymerase eta isoform X2 [Tripterygium wilfordii]
MPVAKPESSGARVIAHVDMDCFYVQVEQRKQPHLRGLPTAVVQYNEWKGGALIAVSYEARKYGVKRSMRGDEAKQVCPQIQLVQVPVARGKADLNAYRNAGSEVVSVLARKGRCERASIDEVYLDLTDASEHMLAENPPESLELIDEEALTSHVLGLKEDGSDTKVNTREWLCRADAEYRDKLLACGAIIVAEARMQVLKETEFTCSAGIAHNKMLAKLASAMNKPAQQTLVPSSSVEGLLSSFPIKKMKQLGGKLGSSLQSDLGVSTVGELLQFSVEKLQECYGINTGTWLWNIARGISGEEVEGRLLPKSHGSGKTFPGPRALKTIASVQHWLNQLCEELSERLCFDLDQNKRIAHTLTLHARAYNSSEAGTHKKFPSKSCPLRYGAAKIQEDAFNLFQAGLREYLGPHGIMGQGSQHTKWGITSLSISASKILAIQSGTCSIMKYFRGQNSSECLPMPLTDNFSKETIALSPTGSGGFTEFISTEPHTELPENACFQSGLGLEEQEMVRGRDQEVLCSSSKQARDKLTRETSPLSLEGIHPRTAGCHILNQNNPERDFRRDEPILKIDMPNMEKQEHRRNTMKDKGTYSILKYLKSSSPSCSSQKEGCAGSVQDAKASLLLGGGVGSVIGSCSEFNDAVLPQENPLAELGSSNGRHSSDQHERRRKAWSYNINEIDQSVIDELPPELQVEIRAALRPHKRPNTAKRGSSISHYFSPTKNS